LQSGENARFLAQDALAQPLASFRYADPLKSFFHTSAMPVGDHYDLLLS
jgi:hypothetical protein